MTKRPKMRFEDAMEIAEGMDLPDGAFWAMAHEIAGLEYGDGFDELFSDDREPHPQPQTPAKPKIYACSECKRKFTTKGGRKQHRRDRHPEVIAAARAATTAAKGETP